VKSKFERNVNGLPNASIEETTFSGLRPPAAAHVKRLKRGTPYSGSPSSFFYD
jgi:hypothetical protein